jgi:hypothetical protein
MRKVHGHHSKMQKLFQIFITVKNKKWPAFSLLEAAISLCIFGIITATLMPLMASFGDAYKKKVTEKTMEEAMQSLAAFVMLHKRLPCPSTPKQLGVAALDCRSPGQFVGILPFKTLGIPEKKARDAYGRWLTYGVSPSLTSFELKGINKAKGALAETQKDSDFFCHVTPFYRLSMLDGQGRSVINENDQEFLAIVLISHGPKGQGILTDVGRTPTFSRAKAMNADGSGNFIDQPLCQRPENYFDDTVRWVTRNSFMAHYGQLCVYE